MGENSKIEWTTHTFNPWMGCTKVAAGCAHCYAERDMDHHYHKVQWGPQGTRVKTSAENWRKPLKWNRDAEAAGERKRVFCASLGDVFEDWPGPIITLVDGGPVNLGTDGRASRGPDDRLTMNDLRRDLFALIDATPWLDWILLTKRPENIRRMWVKNSPERTAFLWGKPGCGEASMYRPNVWLMTSIATQADADKNIPELLSCRELAPVLGISAEPLVGPVDLHLSRSGYQHVDELGAALPENGDPWLRQVDWVIVGGESGPHARPCDVEWIESLRDQCRDSGVPVFIKQLGSYSRAWTPGYTAVGDYDPRLKEFRYSFRDRKGGDWSEWPADLRVREFPCVDHAELR